MSSPYDKLGLYLNELTNLTRHIDDDKLANTIDNLVFEVQWLTDNLRHELDLTVRNLDSSESFAEGMIDIIRDSLTCIDLKIRCTDEKVQEIMQWLAAHVEDKAYHITDSLFAFVNKKDAMRFKLAWG